MPEFTPDNNTQPVQQPTEPLAAVRGEPSYLWRDGQERRLAMINQHAPLTDHRVLEVGCGVGMYTAHYIKRFTPHVAAFDVEFARVAKAQVNTPQALLAVGEAMPYPANYFDIVISNEVLEHVSDDRATIAEMVRVCRPGGRIVIFCPNRWYPVEQHGHYWKGEYHFGNTPLINYLPDRWRDQLAPHVKVYTRRGLLRLTRDLPADVIHYTRIFGGYDNLVYRLGTAGRIIRGVFYTMEKTPLRVLALSHLLVLEKRA